MLSGMIYQNPYLKSNNNIKTMDKTLNSDQVYSFLGPLDPLGSKYEYWIKGFFKYSLKNDPRCPGNNAEWLGEAVEFTPELAVLLNSEGKRAIDCAEPECKREMQAGLQRALATVQSGLESEKADEEALAKEAKAAKEAATEADEVCNAP